MGLPRGSPARISNPDNRPIDEVSVFSNVNGTLRGIMSSSGGMSTLNSFLVPSNGLATLQINVTSLGAFSRHVETITVRTFEMVRHTFVFQ
jgi:hypothetical protein